MMIVPLYAREEGLFGRLSRSKAFILLYFLFIFFAVAMPFVFIGSCPGVEGSRVSLALDGVDLASTTPGAPDVGQDGVQETALGPLQGGDQAPLRINVDSVVSKAGARAVPSYSGDFKIYEVGQPGSDAGGAPPAAPLGDARASVRVAVIVCGLGFDAGLLDLLRRTLPYDVALCFVPHAPDVARSAQRAEADGFSVFPEIPMQHSRLSLSRMGPFALHDGNSTEENLALLDSLLADFPASTYASNYLGDMFMAQSRQFRVIAKNLVMRGVIFFDDTGAGASAFAGDANYYRRVDAVIGADSPQAMGEALDKALEDARNAGRLVVKLYLRSSMVAELKRWIDDLPEARARLVGVDEVE